MGKNNEKRFCLECGKEMPTYARRCKYCNAKAPLDKYERIAQVKDKLYPIAKNVTMIMFCVFLISFIGLWIQNNSLNWKLLCDLSLLEIIVYFYFKYIVFLQKNN